MYGQFIQQRQLDEFQGWSTNGYNSSLHTNVPTGFGIHGFKLELENLTPEQITKIKIVLKNETIFELSGTQVKTLFEIFPTWDQDDAFLYIPYADERMKTRNDYNLGILKTYPNESLRLYIETGDATAQQTTDGDVARLKAFATFGNPVVAGTVTERRTLKRVYAMSMDLLGSGVQRLGDFNAAKPGDNPTAILGMHIANDTAGITNLEIEKNGRTVFESSVAMMHHDLERMEFTPQTDYVHYYPVARNAAEMEMLRTFDGRTVFKPTVTTPGTVEIVFVTVEDVTGGKAFVFPVMK